MATTTHGIGRYVLHLSAALLRLAPDLKLTWLVNSRPRGQSAPPVWPWVLSPTMPRAPSFYRINSTPFTLEEQFELPRVLKLLSPHVFHATSVAVPLFQTCPTVVTVHDLIPLRYPAGSLWVRKLYFHQLLRRALLASRVVLTVSAHTRDDLCKLLMIPSNQVRVVYNGVEREFFVSAGRGGSRARSCPFPPGRPYIFSIANPKPHKNVAGALNAYRLLRDELSGGVNSPGLLLVCQSTPWIEAAINAHPYREDIHRLFPAPEGELTLMYRDAAVFMYPSLYEGFGFPLLEAMAAGTPVVAFRAASIPEVTGNAALLVEALDTEAMAEKVVEILDQPDLAADLCARGIRQAGRFTWEQAARLTLEAYSAASAQVTRPIS